MLFHPQEREQLIGAFSGRWSRWHLTLTYRSATSWPLICGLTASRAIRETYTGKRVK